MEKIFVYKVVGSSKVSWEILRESDFEMLKIILR